MRKLGGLTIVGVAACGDPAVTRDAAMADVAIDSVPYGGPMLSCTNLASNCGPSGASSCCGSPTVTGGMFYRAHDVGSDGMYPDTSFPATVSDFRLDTYEVTVGRFRQFVNAGTGTQASPPPSGAGARTLNGTTNQGGWDPAWDANLTVDTNALVAVLTCQPPSNSWTDTAGANEALPMNCITWYEAFAFCAWDGGFLPTEAESNYAAAGGAEQRAYPWSSPAASLTVDCSYANAAVNGSAACVNPPNGGVTRVGSVSPTGDGKYGQADLAGNVFEWTLDFAHSPQLINPCDDCADLTPSSNRMIRAGHYFNVASYLRTGKRGSGPPSARTSGSGARCARR